MSIGVILLAAGSGRRFGGSVPKQFLPFRGKPLLFHSFQMFWRLPAVRSISVVVLKEDVGRVQKMLRRFHNRKSVRVVAGGQYRGESVRNGLLALEAPLEVVLVHDAARPLINSDLIKRVARAARKHGAALAAWPLADTLKLESNNGRVSKTIPRRKLWLAQTPQGFRMSIALKCLLKPSRYATDDVELAQRKGHRVQLVEGSPMNIKITVPTDLEICRRLA